MGFEKPIELDLRECEIAIEERYGFVRRRGCEGVDAM